MDEQKRDLATAMLRQHLEQRGALPRLQCASDPERDGVSSVNTSFSSRMVARGVARGSPGQRAQGPRADSNTSDAAAHATHATARAGRDGHCGGPGHERASNARTRFALDVGAPATASPPSAPRTAHALRQPPADMLSEGIVRPMAGARHSPHPSACMLHVIRCLHGRSSGGVRPRHLSGGAGSLSRHAGQSLSGSPPCEIVPIHAVASCGDSSTEQDGGGSPRMDVPHESRSADEVRAGRQAQPSAEGTESEANSALRSQADPLTSPLQTYEPAATTKAAAQAIAESQESAACPCTEVRLVRCGRGRPASLLQVTHLDPGTT